MKKKELKRRIERLEQLFSELAEHVFRERIKQDFADGFDDFFSNPEPKENTNQGGIR